MKRFMSAAMILAFESISAVRANEWSVIAVDRVQMSLSIILSLENPRAVFL
jgi:hypothetical protein